MRAILMSDKNGRLGLLLIIAIVIIGSALRFYNLGEFSFWGDELKSISDAKSLGSVKSFFTPSGNAQPKLYFLLLHIWMGFGNGEFFLRTLSVIFSLLAIVATYFLGRDLYNPKVGIIAAFAVAVSPLHLLYDRELRTYSMLTFYSIASLYFFLRALRKDERAPWIGYALFTTLNLYTHYHAFLLLFAQWAYFLSGFKKYKSLFSRLFLTNAVSAIIFLPWLLSGMLYHFKNVSPWTRFQDIFPVIGLTYLAKPLYIIYGLCLGQTLLPWKFWGMLGMALFACLGMIATVNFKKGFEANRAIVIIVIAAMAPGILFSHAMPRYYIFLAPLLYIFLASFLERMHRSRLVLSLFAGILLCWVVGVTNYYTGREFHILATIDPWREAGDYLTKSVAPEDLVINIGSSPINYYYKGPHEEFPKLRHEAFEELMKETANKEWDNIWLLTSDPACKDVSEKVKEWLDANYTLIEEKKYLRDPDYLTKSRFFNKNFLEYRIAIYHYKIHTFNKK